MEPCLYCDLKAVNLCSHLRIHLMSCIILLAKICHMSGWCFIYDLCFLHPNVMLISGSASREKFQMRCLLMSHKQMWLRCGLEVRWCWQMFVAVLQWLYTLRFKMMHPSFFPAGNVAQEFIAFTVLFQQWLDTNVLFFSVSVPPWAFMEPITVTTLDMKDQQLLPSLARREQPLFAVACWEMW